MSAAAGAGAAAHGARRRALPDDVPGAVDQRELPGPVLDRRLLVEAEGLERLGQVTGVQVQQHVGWADERLEQLVRQHVGVGAGRVARGRRG